MSNRPPVVLPLPPRPKTHCRRKSNPERELESITQGVIEGTIDSFLAFNPPKRKRSSTEQGTNDTNRGSLLQGTARTRGANPNTIPIDPINAPTPITLRGINRGTRSRGRGRGGRRGKELLTRTQSTSRLPRTQPKRNPNMPSPIRKINPNAKRADKAKKIDAPPLDAKRTPMESQEPHVVSNISQKPFQKKYTSPIPRGKPRSHTSISSPRQSPLPPNNIPAPPKNLPPIPKPTRAYRSPVTKKRSYTNAEKPKLSKPTRAPPSIRELHDCRSSIYFGVTARQSIILEQMDEQFSDCASSFQSVVDSSEEMEDNGDLLPEIRHSRSESSEETWNALASLDIDIPEVSMFNLEEPGSIETSRKQRGSVAPGVWEGWRRRVKRQAWEEWEQRLPSTTTLSKVRETFDMPTARKSAQEELDGRQVTPYWLIHWWLTKNSTDRPTVSKHPLLELLLDNENIMDALATVTTSVPDLNKLAYSLVCIFDGCGKIMPLIYYFIAKEIGRTTSSGTLLRNNTITTKIISSYCKIAGVHFIKKLLTPLIKNVVGLPITIEIDPKKYKGNDLEGEQTKLLALCQEFLDRIIYCEDIPITFHLICANLKMKISEKFSQEATYFGIGGFIFLRLLCPSIVAPEAFGLIPNGPPSSVRRTLILVSKLIQNVANGATKIKEDYLEVCNQSFMKTNTVAVHAFYDRLTEVAGHSDDEPLIPVPLVEEALTITHHLVITKIDSIKDHLMDIDETEDVSYNVFDNLSTVLLKSNIILDTLRTQGAIDPSSPLFKPYSLLVDVILADGCKIIVNLLQNIHNTADKENIAEALMVIVHEHGDSVHFIKTLINKDITAAFKVNSVLTGSSVPNLLFSGLLKVLTRTFITTHWGSIIKKINETNECLELDPPRAPVHFDLMKANETLTTLADELISVLHDKRQHIDRQAREICAFVQKKVVDKFGSNAVHKFYGARILCDRVFIPAVSYPMLFHLLPDVPAFHARRTFVLLSTVMRNCLRATVFDSGYFITLNHLVRSKFDVVENILTEINTPQGRQGDLHPTWEAQGEALLVLHKWTSDNLASLKTSLEKQNNTERIIYSVYDRLAAVIALYRYRLRRRIASGEYSALSLTDNNTTYSDYSDKLHE